MQVAFPGADWNEYIMSISCYMDETGHSKDERQRFNGMAGLVAPYRVWVKFQQQWKTVLKLKRFNIDHFHMKDFANFNGLFDGWSEDKRQDLFGRLIKVIASTLPVPFGSVIPMEYFRELSVEHRKLFIDPYFLAFMNCAQIPPYILQGRPDNERCKMIFGEQKEFMNLAIRLYVIFKKRFPLASRLSPPGFEDMKKVVPLQAADIVAYEMYKEAERRIYRSDAKPRYGFKEIEKMGPNIKGIPSMIFHSRESLKWHVDSILDYQRRMKMDIIKRH